MSGRDWPVCGHQRVRALLAGELLDRRVRHAYLISGPVSVGKTTLANVLAAALICPHVGESGSPCLRCDDCRRVARGIHPDLHRFSLETQRQLAKEKTSSESLTVETVREITAVSALRAYSSEYRVIILEDAGNLTEVAQEALLKTLEEPPSQLVLILLAERPDALLPTIRSRCEQIVLSPVPEPELAACLVAAGQTEERASQLAALAQGLPGWAFRAIEDDSLVDGRISAWRRASEWVDATPFDRMVRAFQLAGDFAKSRDVVFAELASTAGYWRAVMMSAAGYDTGDVIRHEPMAPTSVTLGDSHRALVAVTQCMNDLERSIRPRLALEAMVMQWPVISPAEK